MFLHDYTYVDLPRELVCARLAVDARAGLEALAALAGADGDALRRRIDATAPAPSLTRATVVTAGEAADVGGVTLIPLVWRTAAGTPPIAVADLEIAPLGRDRTQLTVLGRSTDSRADGPVQYRVVQATVRSFLSHLAGRLEAQAAAGVAPGLRLPIAS